MLAAVGEDHGGRVGRGLGHAVFEDEGLRAHLVGLEAHLEVAAGDGAVDAADPGGRVDRQHAEHELPADPAAGVRGEVLDRSDEAVVLDGDQRGVAGAEVGAGVEVAVLVLQPQEVDGAGLERGGQPVAAGEAEQGVLVVVVAATAGPVAGVVGARVVGAAVGGVALAGRAVGGVG
ncbi:MAG: hypothetical protein ACK559_10425, partial [bacterium]